MATDQDRRMALGGDVSRLLAHPEVDSLFPARLASGKRNILVAVDSETCGELLKRMASYRGAVNVVIGAKAGTFDVVVFQRSVVPTKSAQPTTDNCEVGNQASLDFSSPCCARRGR